MMILFILFYQSCTGCIASGCTPPGCAGRCGCPSEPVDAPIDEFIPYILTLILVVCMAYLLYRTFRQKRKE